MPSRIPLFLVAAFCCSLAFASIEQCPRPPIRLAYNYCTLSYTFAYYSDDEWKSEIDRLASIGCNVALVIDGTFKVWYDTLRELGFDEESILAFLPDECARAWWLMGNLYGEGGALDSATIEEDGQRGRRICQMMREKGIEPILQSFAGMVPPGYPRGRVVNQGYWSCYPRPPILDPCCEEFSRVADVWYRNLEKTYGIKPRYLAGDLFHEGGNAASIDVTSAVRQVQDAMQRAFPGVVWVVQAWQNNPTAAVRSGLNPRYTLVEALVKDMSSAPAPKSYGELPWIWCEVLNFGGNHGLYGNLATYSRLGDVVNPTFRGYGFLSEGFFTNPVANDLFVEMANRPQGSSMTKEELGKWLEDWTVRRYGVTDANAIMAWRILASTVYACDREQEGTVENVMCARPSFRANNVSTWGPRGGLWYEAQELEKALLFLEKTRASENCLPFLKFDLADLRRQIFANKARAIVSRLESEPAAREEFLSLFGSLASAIDECEAFSLEKQLERARRRAGKRGERAFYRMVTSWTAPSLLPNSLEDYANREYSSLVRQYYLPRWKSFFRAQTSRLTQ